MIEVENLSYAYPGSEPQPALRGISFRLDMGETVALMGANGSGKTTLIRCLNGLLEPGSGHVRVDGNSTQDGEALYRVRRLVGMVFQNPDNQIVSTTVIRELAFGLENLGVQTDEMHERVEEALRRFHLEGYRDTPPHLLSGGERQRLALASVWIMEPNYLVLDEPTSLLDPQGREEVFRMIEDTFTERRTGVLFATQFPEEAMRFHRLLVMHRGEVVLDGSPGEVFRQIKDRRELGLDIPVEVELEMYGGDRLAAIR